MSQVNFGNLFNNPGQNYTAQTQERRPRIHRVNLASGASTFNVDLNTTYKNVVRIELVHAQLVIDDGPRYIVVKINGMQQHGGNTSTLDNAFCTLAKTNHPRHSYEYSRGSGGSDYMYTYEFPGPVNLNNLNITLYQPDGTAATLTDTDGTVTDSANQLMVFEIMESTNFGQ